MVHRQSWAVALLISTLAPTAGATPLDPGAFTSLAPSLAPPAALSVDTDTLQMSGGASHTGVVDGGVAVFTFDDVLLDGVDLVVTGSRPVALLSKGALVLSDAASVQLLPAAAVGHAGGGDGGGIGADGGGPGPGVGSAGGGGGGGAHCGVAGAGTTAGGAAYGDPAVALTGGSGGGGGDGASGGAGAGAIELGALGPLWIDGTSTVLASGAPGTAGPSGGGGGGGGGILLHGLGGGFDGTIAARGGAGGAAATGTRGGGGGGGCVWITGLAGTTGTVLLAGGDGEVAGAAGILFVDLDQDGDGALASVDCDDTDPDRYPGAIERCNGIDDSCDLLLHPSEIDGDGDGHVPCTFDPGGWLGDPAVVGDRDCDDGDGTRYVGAPELCDGLDNDCDGTLLATEIDGDGDGYAICALDPGGWDGPGTVVGGDDCDDGVITIHPGATDLCGNGIDDDCDDLGAHGPNAGSPGGWLDDDGDGLDFSTEVGLGIDDCDADTDDDLLTDDEEIGLGTAPGDADTDEDGLDDGLEILVTGTDPLLADSDGDSVGDSDELGSILAPLDTDGDGLIDALDDDDDGDSVPTRVEALLGDSDGDGDDDYLDDDDDNDGVPTDVEEQAGTGRLEIDSDGDGFLDGEEWLNWLRTSPDVDCPALAPQCDDRLGGATGSSLSDPWDRDADGEINALDADDDGDGLLSLIEGGAHSECLSTYPGDGIPDYLDEDSDGDGIADRDELPGDSDGDGLLDRLDCTDDGCLGDGDSDGVPNCRETELTGDPNAQSTPDYDGDGVTDGLEIGDPRCLEPQGPCSPADTDGDGVLDLSDVDDDGDAFHTTFELGLCPNGGDPTLEYRDGWSLRCGNGELYLPRNTDAARGDWLPLQPDDTPDYLDDDDDGDGALSFAEGAGDLDGDGTPNWLDPNDVDGPDADADLDGIDNATEAELGLDPYDDDSDNDGVADLVETGDPGRPTDTDDDGLIDALDDDDDDDGLPTVLEGIADPDGDDIPNHLDTDSDGDGTPDATEGLTDYDCDKIPAFLDPLDDEGPCTVVPAPRERYQRGSCSSAPQGPVGSLIVLLLIAGSSRRRKVAAR